MAEAARAWVVQVEGPIPAAWDVSPAGRASLLEAAASVGGAGGRASLELDDDQHSFRFLLILPAALRRPDDIAKASREGLQEAIATLGLVGTSVVWRTFDVLDDGS